MISRIRSGVRLLRGLHNPGKNLNVLPDDTFVVSYPKSGNTWARFLIANLLHPETPADFSNIDEFVPDVESTAKRIFDRASGPRIIKSHYCYTPEYKKLIYIVRDPRDVAVSQYHYQRKRRVISDKYPLDAFVDKFLAGETCSYGSWGTNVGSWLATHQHDPRFLLLRYEDMIQDTPRALAKMASFLNVPMDPERIACAIERSSADNMRRLEQKQSQASSLTNGRKDIPFIRSAKSGGWRAELPEALALKIEQAWSPLMRHLGYELTPVTPNADGLRTSSLLLHDLLVTD